jgi:FixJ family two-component response regulator
MARNEVVDAVRRIKCRVTLVEEADHRALSSEQNDVAHFEIKEAVNHAIECLPHPEREIILRIIAGHSYQSIAAHSGLTPAAVKIRVFRMRQILRPRMLEALGETTAKKPEQEKRTETARSRRKGKTLGKKNASRSAATAALRSKQAPRRTA